MIDQNRLARVKAMLSDDDISVIATAVRFVGGDASQPFKDRLVGAIVSGYDYDRVRMLEGAVRQLNEEEILLLVEHPKLDKEERRKRRIRGGF